MSVSGTVPPSSLAFPVLAIDKMSFSVRRAVEDLTDVWQLLLKSGWFEGLRLVDSSAANYEVASVRQLHGVGPFWGFTLRYGRKVRVDLELRRAERQLGFEEIRQLISQRLTSGQEWESRDDIDELRDEVRSATSLAALRDVLTKRGF